MAGNTTGPDTLLDKELLTKIKQGVLDGKSLKDIAKDNGLSESTLYNWKCQNYVNLGDKIEGWKRDRKLLLAEQKIEGILSLDISDKDTLRVQSDIAKFTAETLGKDVYSKRTEVTGKGGEKLFELDDKAKQRIKTVVERYTEHPGKKGL